MHIRGDRRRLARTGQLIANPKVRPNAPCPCKSGKKYKACCGLVRVEKPVDQDARMERDGEGDVQL